MKGKKIWVVVGILSAIALAALIFELVSVKRDVASIKEATKTIIEEADKAEDKIAEIGRENCRSAIAEVLQIADPAIKEAESTEEQKKAAEKFEAELLQIYEVADGAERRYAIEVSSAGSQGTIDMVVGFDKDGRIGGVSVVSSSETAGIGSKVIGNGSTDSGAGALDQYRGKNAEDYPLEFGEGIDVISGATVTSEGVKNGVNAAIAVFQLLKQ